MLQENTAMLHIMNKASSLLNSDSNRSCHAPYLLINKWTSRVKHLSKSRRTTRLGLINFSKLTSYRQPTTEMNLIILSYFLLLTILSFTSAATRHGRQHRHARNPNISLASATTQEIEAAVILSTDDEKNGRTHRSHRYKHTLVPVRREVARVEQGESKPTGETREEKGKTTWTKFLMCIAAAGLLFPATFV